MALHAAIDPLSMLLPSSVYIAFMNKLHPNEPAIHEAMAKMTAAEKAESVAMAHVMKAAAEAVIKAAAR